MRERERERNDGFCDHSFFRHLNDKTLLFPPMFLILSTLIFESLLHSRIIPQQRITFSPERRKNSLFQLNILLVWPTTDVKRHASRHVFSPSRILHFFSRVFTIIETPSSNFFVIRIRSFQILRKIVTTNIYCVLSLKFDEIRDKDPCMPRSRMKLKYSQNPLDEIAGANGAMFARREQDGAA